MINVAETAAKISVENRVLGLHNVLGVTQNDINYIIFSHGTIYYDDSSFESLKFKSELDFVKPTVETWGYIISGTDGWALIHVNEMAVLINRDDQAIDASDEYILELATRLYHLDSQTQLIVAQGLMNPIVLE